MDIKKESTATKTKLDNLPYSCGIDLKLREEINKLLCIIMDYEIYFKILI